MSVSEGVSSSLQTQQVVNTCSLHPEQNEPGEKILFFYQMRMLIDPCKEF